MAGPLAGVRVVEVGGIGPGPFAGMMLSDLGAEVIRIDRPGQDLSAHSILLRGRRRLKLDLKDPRARDVVAALASRSDVLLEGARPGVMERLGLGPDELLRNNPRLVYGRMTGWGQDGPMATTAGHDINYIAVAGALEPIGADAPTPPLNMLGDFGGGGMLLVAGVLAALLHARATGEGQVVDAAIVDGTALMTAMLHAMRAEGDWSPHRGHNLFDGGAPFYGVYRTQDERWVAVGAIEPPFYAQLLEGLGLTQELEGLDQRDTSTWSAVREQIAACFASRTRDHWQEVFDGTDACVTPVLTPQEAPQEPQLSERGTYLNSGSLVQPAPAPRFSATPADLGHPCGTEDLRELLRSLGLDRASVEELLATDRSTPARPTTTPGR